MSFKRVKPARAAGEPYTAPKDIDARLRERLRIKNLRAKAPGFLNRLGLGVALVGPGLLVMLGDNDAGSVITYIQTGALNGYGLFLPLLVPLGLIAYLVQEMTIRLGAVTKCGHAELIWKRYGAFWGAFSLIDLIIANSLTLMTEFIGIRLASAVFGISYLITIPLAFIFIVATLLCLKYRSWERFSLALSLFNLVFIPLALWSHPDWSAIGRAFTGTGWAMPGGFFSASFLILVAANTGTTISPWQLFFQQSCVVDKGLLPKDIAASRFDLMLGVVGMVLVAMAVIILGTKLHGLPDAAAFDGNGLLMAIGNRIGHVAMVVFALGLVEAGLIAGVVITASTAWSIGGAFDLPCSLNLPPRQAVGFYGPAIACTALAAGLLMLPHISMGFLNLTVQMVATILMPAAMLFLLMLLNDRALLQDHVNSRLRNSLSIGVIILLVACNGLYGLATVFPKAL